jgi:putative addiction module component (TIGR02574 family)
MESIMSISNDDLTTQALALPVGKRIALAQQLWDSVGGPESAMTEEEVDKEVSRRAAEIEAGEVEGISHEDVMRAARKAIGLT